MTKNSVNNEMLDSPRMVTFSETFLAARDISAETIKKHALKSLLTAVVEGNEALAREFIISHPELLLDCSAIVTDLSGKKIEGLTPLQAAICSGDIDMVQMMKEVLQRKIQRGVQLGFEPELEMQRQFAAIYPDGIDAVYAAQIAKADDFKNANRLENYNLLYIFTSITTASEEQIKFELETPGQNNSDSPLNAALHNFRAQFTSTSNQELIFNPFYLLMAFEFYNEEFDNFNDPDRRDLFWRQVIGYIQRHLSACYLQAFARSIYYIVEYDEKVRRDFEFNDAKGSYMRANKGELNNLGYNYAAMLRIGGGAQVSGGVFKFSTDRFKKFLRTKKSGLENLFTRIVMNRYVIS
jgi:hypothetical protein